MGSRVFDERAVESGDVADEFEIGGVEGEETEKESEDEDLEDEELNADEDFDLEDDYGLAEDEPVDEREFEH